MLRSALGLRLSGQAAGRRLVGEVGRGRWLARRYAAPAPSWRWAGAFSGADTLPRAVAECAEGLKHQMSGDGEGEGEAVACDLLLVQACGHESTKGIAEMIQEAGVASRVLFGGTSTRGVDASRVAGGPALSLTACVLPDVEITPFYCSSATLPVLPPTFAWDAHQQPDGPGEASVMLLQASRFLFDEDKWLGLLDVAFPYMAKVGALHGSRTGQYERHIARSLTAESGGGVRRKRDVIFLNDQRYVQGAAAVILKGRLAVDVEAATTLRRLGPALPVSELLLGGVFSLEGSYVWTAVNEMLATHGVDNSDKVSVALVKRHNRGQRPRNDPSPRPYARLRMRVMDNSRENAALYLDDDVVEVGDSLQFFIHSEEEEMEMRQRREGKEAMSGASKDLTVMVDSLLHSSFSGPEDAHRHRKCLADSYRKYLDDNHEDVEAQELMDDARARTQEGTAGMELAPAATFQEASEAEGERDAVPPAPIFLAPHDDGLLVVDPAQLQEQHFPQRRALAMREAKVREHLDERLAVYESDEEASEHDAFFVDSDEEEEEEDDEELERRLEESLERLEAAAGGRWRTLLADRPLPDSTAPPTPSTRPPPYSDLPVEKRSMREAPMLATACVVPARGAGGVVTSLPAHQARCFLSLRPSAVEDKSNT